MLLVYPSFILSLFQHDLLERFYSANDHENGRGQSKSNQLSFGACAMELEGEVLHVMETWPLQLVVVAADGRYDVRLLETTRVVRKNREVRPGELRPKVRISISGMRTGTAIVAQYIKILD